MSVMTFLSRILGLIRDVVVARLMGDGAAADVFFFANKIPNFLRRLFAEGAFAQAFIPVLTEVHHDEDKAQMRAFIARVSGTLGAIVFVVAIVGVIASPVLTALFGTGWFIAWLVYPDPPPWFFVIFMKNMAFRFRMPTRLLNQNATGYSRIRLCLNPYRPIII